ncbi:MAG TPA: ComF family protein [Armatimonadota bacterium]|nr:ComF family protein [Armatimonadota bacterium]
MKTPVIDGLIDIVYPPKCLTCESLNPHHLCESCLLQIERIPRPYCPTCGHPMRRKCNLCWGREPSFTTARAAGVYTGVIREAIHAFKYGGARMLADPLAQVLYRYLTVYADIPWRRAECIVPVPIYPARKRVRGYNQSELLAERLGVMTGLPLAADAVVRKRHTRPQVELSREERLTNVAGAFGVRKPELIRGKIVLLVDDVATTCSTIHECSLALLEAGARKVYVACLAFGA